MRKFIQISAWVLVTIFIISLICACLNAPNTLLAVGGFIMAVVWIVLSIKTKCFTHMPFRRLHH